MQTHQKARRRIDTCVSHSIHTVQRVIAIQTLRESLRNVELPPALRELVDSPEFERRVASASRAELRGYLELASQVETRRRPRTSS